jgi:hypothetical protein
MTGLPLPAVLIGIAVGALLTCLLLLAALAIARSKGKILQPDDRFSPSGALADGNRGWRLKMLVLAVLVILNVVIWLAVLLSRAPGHRTAESTSTASLTAGGRSSSASPLPASAPTAGSADEQDVIQVEDVADSARPFETVRIQGTYRGGPDTFLRVQRWEGGKWLDFPVPTKTDRSGKFTAHLELAQPGRYRLRMSDPGSSVTSKPFVLVIKA